MRPRNDPLPCRAVYAPAGFLARDARTGASRLLVADRAEGRKNNGCESRALGGEKGERLRQKMRGGGMAAEIVPCVTVLRHEDVGGGEVWMAPVVRRGGWDGGEVP